MLRTLSLFILTIAAFTAHAGEQVSVFWWNIQTGITNQRTREEKGFDTLAASLARAMRDQSPDFIVLGEFAYGAIDTDLLREIRKTYSEKFITYHSGWQDTGIKVFWKRPIALKDAILKDIDWAPPEHTVREKENYRKLWNARDVGSHGYSRYYIRLIYEKNGRRINLVPVHLNMPWLHITSENEKAIGAKPMARFRAKARTAFDIVGGTENPLYYQASELRRELEKDFGPKLDREPLLIVGDFNIPSQLAMVEPKSLGLISKYMGRAFSKYYVRSTFPSKESAEYGKVPGLRIDHAFYSKPQLKLEHSSVLKVPGSDHYPVFVVVEMRDDCERFILSKRLMPWKRIQ